MVSFAALTHARALKERQLPEGCSVDDGHTICPPGVTPPGNCHTHEPNEWHCDPTTTATVPTTKCTTLTTITGIDYTITDFFEEFYTKISKYLTEVTHSNDLVNVFTVTAGDSLGYGYVPKEILEKVGITDFYTTTANLEIDCPKTGVPTLPPSPTGKDCVAHGDHWDCKPIETGTDDDHSTTGTLPPSPTGQDCVAHGDHWDCKPTETGTDDDHSTTGTLPPSPTGKDCHAHGDHWHCDEPEPTETGDDSHSGTGVLPPSPTGSACEAHGDHWDCEPLPTQTQCAAGNNSTNCPTTPATTTSTTPEETGAAAPLFGSMLGTMCAISVFIVGLVMV